MENIWHPGELLNASSAYWRGCTLQAAVRLKIFSTLGDGSLTAAELSSQLNSETKATALLLDALSGMELLVKEDNGYRNSSSANRFLVESSPQYMGFIILHHHHLLDGWAQLDEVVRTGSPVSKRSYGQEIERESFIMGMFNLASLVAPEVATQLDLTDRKRLLDLGGGPGTYAIHFCKANPELKATIYDKGTTEPFAMSTVEKFGLGERIDFEAGDFNLDPISGGPYDAAWLSHILHSNSLDDCYALVKKCADAMEPGGLIMIHDFILDDAKDGPEFPTLFSLNMLLANNDGRSYSEGEISDMLSAAGVGRVKRHSFRAKNDSSIIFGIVQ